MNKKDGFVENAKQRVGALLDRVETPRDPEINLRVCISWKFDAELNCWCGSVPWCSYADAFVITDENRLTGRLVPIEDSKPKSSVEVAKRDAALIAFKMIADVVHYFRNGGGK